MNASLFSCAILMITMLIPTRGWGQWREPPATGSPSNELPDRTTLAGQSGLGPLLIAELLDKEENAKQRRAVVKVETDGVRIVDPASAHYQPRLDEAHIRYQIDDGNACDSTAKVWTFKSLPSGEHHIKVTLASSDGQQIGKGKLLKVRIP
jgi:hypothetical protein